MAMRDVLGAIYDDAQFAALFSARGYRAEAPWRLALVTVMQFAEGLSDWQAAEAVRARIDWKYARATRGRIVRVGSGQTLPQVSVPDLSPILACVAGNSGVRSRG
jgi:transposase